MKNLLKLFAVLLFAVSMYTPVDAAVPFNCPDADDCWGNYSCTYLKNYCTFGGSQYNNCVNFCETSYWCTGVADTAACGETGWYLCMCWAHS